MNKIRIAIDGRMYQQSGIGRYIRNLLTHLQVLDKENEYFILHQKEDYEKLVYQSNFHKVLADFGWYGIKEQVKLPGILKSLKVDLVHFPHFNAPFFYNGKFIVTIHDLIHQHFSMERATTHGAIVYKIKQAGYKKIFNNALTKSAAILVPSNFVKNQLVTDWNVNREKITVTQEAVDEKFPKTKGTKKSGFPYIFYVGNAHPHKNVEGLIKTYLILKNKYKTLKLVLAGSDHYFWQRIKREFTGYGIIYAGQISDEELSAYYKNAKAFVMPSFEEGFGIPLLEAMACGCPVVSSNKGSLMEVGGEAAEYFDPVKPDDMVEKIIKVLEDKKLRNNMIEKGLKRYKEFSWKKLTEQTLEVYRKCV